jgi:hypothetical protein
MIKEIDTPKRLYKYLPYKYVKQIIQEGALLFRNLTYFRQYEDRIRGDQAEGIHIDNPDNHVTINILNKGITLIDDCSFLNSIEQDKVFVFCMSTILKQNLFDEFGADSCIVIENVSNFLLRCRSAIMRSPNYCKCGFLHRQVDYYRPNECAQRSVKDSKNLPFFKAANFEHQCEYRLVCGLKDALKLKQRLVKNKGFSFSDEIKSGQPLQRLFRIGKLEGIARVVRRHEVFE